MFLKKFNLYCEEIIKSTKNFFKDERLRKIDEKINFSSKIDDLSNEEIEIINDKINRNISNYFEELRVRGMKWDFEKCLLLIYDGSKWIEQSLKNVDKKSISKDYIEISFNDNEEEKKVIDINNIIVISGLYGKSSSTYIVVENFIDNLAKNSNIEQYTKTFKFPEDIQFFIDKNIINKKELLTQFFNSQRNNSYNEKVIVKTILKDSDWKEILTKYFKIDIESEQFKEAIKYENYSREELAHTKCNLLRLNILISWDKNKNLEDQKFSAQFLYKYEPNNYIDNPGF